VSVKRTFPELGRSTALYDALRCFMVHLAWYAQDGEESTYQPSRMYQVSVFCRLEGRVELRRMVTFGTRLP
jgi:hypothetical protein